MSGLETNGSPQLELFQSFLRGFEKKDVSLIEKTLHKDHLRITHPRSIGMPVQNKEEYIKNITGLIGLWSEKEASSSFGPPSIFLLQDVDSPLQQFIHSVVEVPGKVIVHVRIPFRQPPGALTQYPTRSLQAKRRPHSGWT